MIKVYQAISNPYKMPNPFVCALIDGIENQYDDIKWGWGYDKFWTDRIFSYDIVLFQWPEALIFWSDDTIHTINDLKFRLEEIKAKGIKIISFVHNLIPHYNIDKEKSECYNSVYSMSDCLIHMGGYSAQSLQSSYPDARHVNIGSHFLYDEIYKSVYSKEQGLAMLGLESKYRYILSFGAFRDDEEREFVANIAKELNKCEKDIIMLAPCYMDIPSPKHRFDIKPRWTKYQLKHKNHIICAGKTFNAVPDSLLPYYYAVADACFVQRKKILNSGTVPMAFLMEKVVAGPNIGNVGEILTEMGNPTFDVNDNNTAVDAILTALDLAKEGKGQWNHDYAMNNFSTEIFCEKLHEIFVDCIK